MKLWKLLRLIGLPLPLILAGCATPPEIKTASRAQIELITAVNDATETLNQGLVQFHRDQQARIFDEGRVLIARQAINVAVPDTNSLASADGVFKVSNEKVRPWVDNAFSGPEIDAAIAQTQARLNNATNVFVKGSLQNDLDDLNLLKTSLSQKPAEVAQLEAIIQQDAQAETETSNRVSATLKLLQAQLGLMKAAAVVIDDWLTIDVTLSQEQTDSLAQAFSEAKAALDKGGP